MIDSWLGEIANCLSRVIAWLDVGIDRQRLVVRSRELKEAVQGND